MPAGVESPEKLHHLLIRHVIDTGHAPTLQTLAALAQLTQEKTAEVLRELEQIHGVILVPNSLGIWSLHPFALHPTAFWVSTAAGGWWANCAWCSLGIWAALKQDAAISTSDGGEGDTLEFAIEGGQPCRTDLLMHFPYPPERWWDNPFAPCANILFFSSEAHIDTWCLRHGHPRGSALPINLAVQLSDLWFGDYASIDWVRKTPERATEIFAGLGLDRSFWKLSAKFR
jgi:hypothetical protein